MNSNFKLEKRHILLGLAVDVSGSMEQSIRNQDDQNDNGFKAFRSSLKDLSKKVKREIEARQKEGIIVSVDVFAQAFGLQEVENCDLLTLIEFGQEFAETPKSQSSNGFSDPYHKLKDIARENGIPDIDGFSSWIKEAVPYEEQASRLAVRLHENPRLAKHLAELLPKDSFQANITSIAYTAKNNDFIKFATFGISGYIAENVIDPTGKSEQLEKAKILAREIADASSQKEIRQIVIREVGSQLGNELARRGNRLKPLEKVADLLESKEDEIEDLETLIYGNTPMCSALQVIQKRFRTELAKLPQNTISVLFILSDGEPTDGNPLPFANQLKGMGTYIVSCFLTNHNIIDPRKLFDEVSYEWRRGARLMFDMASKVDRDSVFVESLIERRWKVPLHPKLFVQANHTDLLNEFTQIIVSLCKEKI